MRGPEFESSGDAGPQLPAAAVEAMARGQKIEAIKIVREQTGLGLADAKALVEGTYRGGSSGMSRRGGKEDSGVLRLVVILAILGAVAAFFLMH